MYLPSLPHMTAGCGALGAVYAVAKYRKSLTLEKLLVKSLTAGSLPTGFYLLGAAFIPSLAAGISDLGLYLLAAGVALLFVSITELAKP